MSQERSDFTKVHVDLPNHWRAGGESVWAKSLGDDLYEVVNVPFSAYGLNLGDVVRADSGEADQKPVVRTLVRQSGNRTLRVSFCDKLTIEEQQPILNAIEFNGCEYERFDAQFVSINVPHEASYEEICSYLVNQESQGRLEYETCEARVDGSFDDKPRRPHRDVV